MDNVHYLPGSNVIELASQKRTNFRDLAALAGNFGDALDVALGAGRKSPNIDDMIKLSEALDTVALRARNYGYALSKPAFLVVAQDAESLSERILLLAANIGDKK